MADRKSQAPTESPKLDAARQDLAERHREALRKVEEEKQAATAQARHEAEKFEAEKEYGRAADVHERLFNLESRYTPEIFLKIVTDRALAGEFDKAQGFIARIQKEVERSGQHTKGLSKELVHEIKEVWPVAIKSAKRIICRAKGPKEVAIESGSSHAYITEAEEAAEGDTPEKGVQELGSEWTPQFKKQYMIRISHVKTEKTGQRVYGEPAPIGPLRLDRLVTTRKLQAEEAEGIVGIKGLGRTGTEIIRDEVRKMLGEIFESFPETPGEIAVEIVDPDNDNVVYSFDEEIDATGKLKEEVVTLQQVETLVRSWGVDFKNPEAFTKRKREEMMKAVKELDGQIDRTDMGDCKRAIKALDRGGQFPLAGVEALKGFANALPKTRLEGLTLLMNELRAQEEQLIGQVLQAAVRKEEIPSKKLGETIPFAPPKGYWESLEKLEKLQEGIEGVLADINYYTSSYRIRNLLEARKKALEEISRLAKQAAAQEKEERERFDEAKEEQLKKLMGTIGFEFGVSNPEQFVDEQFIEYEDGAVPTLKQEIVVAPLDRLEQIIGNDGDAQKARMWFDRLRATVLELQGRLLEFKPGPQSPKERIDFWVLVVQALKKKGLEYGGKVEEASKSLYELANERIKLLELENQKNALKGEVPSRIAEYIARVGGIDKTAAGEALRNPEYFRFNIALRDAERAAFDTFAKFRKEEDRLAIMIRDFEVVRSGALEFAKRFGVKNGMSEEEASEKMSQLAAEVRTQRLANPGEFKYSHIKEDWILRAAQGTRGHVENILKGIGVGSGSEEAETLLALADFIEAARIFQETMGRKRKEPRPAEAAVESTAAVAAPVAGAPERAPTTEQGPALELKPVDILSYEAIRFVGFKGARSLADVRGNLTRLQEQINRALEDKSLSPDRRRIVENDLAGAKEALAIMGDSKRAAQALRGIQSEVQVQLEELDPQMDALRKDQAVFQNVARLYATRHSNRSPDDRALLEKLKEQYDLYAEWFPAHQVNEKLGNLTNEAYGEFKETLEAKHQRYAENLEASILLWALEDPALKDAVQAYIKEKKFPQEGQWSNEHKAALRELVTAILPKFNFALCSKPPKYNPDLDSRAARDLIKIAGIPVKNGQFAEVSPGTRKYPYTDMYINTGDMDGVYTRLLDAPAGAKTSYLRSLLDRGIVPDPKQFRPEDRSIFVDHHSGKSGADTSSAKDMFETLAYLGFFEGKNEQAIKEAVQLVTFEDNKSHPKWEDRESDWWKGNWRRTMLGLAARIPFETVVAYAKDHPGTDFTEELTDADVKKYRLTGDLKNLETAFKSAEEVWKELEKNGYSRSERREQIFEGGKKTGKTRTIESQQYLLKVPDSKLGELSVVICQGDTFPAGIDAIKALAGKNAMFIRYNPPPRYAPSFFASHASEDIPEDLFGDSGKRMRKRMWVFDAREADQYPFSLRTVLSGLGISPEAVKASPKLVEAIAREEGTDPESEERKEIERVYDVVETYLGETLGFVRNLLVADTGIKDPDNILQEKLGYQLYALLKGDTELWHDYKIGKEKAKDPDPDFMKIVKDQLGAKLAVWLMAKADIAQGSPDEIDDRLANVFGSAWPDVQALIHTPESA